MNSTNLNIALKFVFAFILFATVFQSHAKASGGVNCGNPTVLQGIEAQCSTTISSECTHDVIACDATCAESYEPGGALFNQCTDLCGGQYGTCYADLFGPCVAQACGNS